MKKVNIIIPVYNKGKYLDRCLKSILKQKGNFLLNVIIVDDGSMDNSVEIASKYTELYDNYELIINDHKGVSETRNTGLKNASGDFVLFVDADDSINKDYVSTLVNAYEENDVDLVVSGLVKKTNNNIVCGKIQLNYQNLSLKKNGYIKFFNDKSLFEIVYTRLFNLNIIKQHNITFKDQQFGEDTLFMMEYLKYVDNVLLLSYIGYNNYIIGQTLSRRRLNNVWEETVIMADKSNDYFHDNYGRVWHYLYLRSIKLTLLNNMRSYASFKKICEKITTDWRFSNIKISKFFKTKDKIFTYCLKHRLFYLIYSKYKIMTKE